MTATTENRLTDEKGDSPIARLFPALPVAASTTIRHGVMVGINLSGYLVEVSADPTIRVLGRSEEYVDNSAGAAGAKTCKVKRGIFGWTNSASTLAVADTHVGRLAFAVDNQTVALRNPTGVYPIAGRVYDVDADGQVFIEHGVESDQPGGVSDLFLLAGADLSTTGQNRFVALDSAGDVVLAATAGMVALGCLLNAPASGAVAIVRRRGPCRMLAEAAVAEGVCIAVAVTTGRYKTAVNTTCDASGASATAALTGSFIMGQTLEESTGAGDLALVDIHPMGCRPGTLA
jgi:hypothetical protein